MDFPLIPRVTERLFAHLGEVGRRYPRAWRQLDEMRARRDELGRWPPWCFCPMAGSYAIVCDRHGLADLDRFADPGAYGGGEGKELDEPIFDVSRVAALGAWRVTQGVHVIDPDVLDAVLNTPLDGAIPVDVLMRLPEWCVYVPTPGLTDVPIGVTPPGEVFGFFAHLEHDSHDGRVELRLLVDYERHPPRLSLTPEILHLFPGDTVEGSYTRMLLEADKQARARGFGDVMANGVYNRLLKTSRERLSPLLSVLLYLCSGTAEFREAGRNDFTRPGNPEPTRTKQGWRLFPPPKPKIWYVGERIGKAIREVGVGRESSERSGPRPHVRRAHWHTYWLGSRKGGQRPELKWLPPIPVAMAEDTPGARMRHAKPGKITDLGAEAAAVSEELERRGHAPDAGEGS